jgi:hypothetical protein
MQQHIRIGMAQQAFFIGDPDATQNQWSTLHQRMYVVALANAKWRSVPF